MFNDLKDNIMHFFKMQFMNPVSWVFIETIKEFSYYVLCYMLSEYSEYSSWKQIQISDDNLLPDAKLTKNILQ